MDQRRMILSIVRTLFLDAGLAVGAYLIASKLGATLFTALLIGAVVAMIRAGYVIIRRRTVDAFAIFMIITFGIGLLLTLVSGSPRFLLAKEAIGTGVSGLIFLITLVVGRPMMFFISQRFAATDDDERLRWKKLWSTQSGFRQHFRRLTLVWAIGFLLEATVKVILVLLLPVATAAPVLPFFTPVLVTALVVWTVRSSALAQERLAQASQLTARS